MSKQNSRLHKIQSLLRRNDWKQAYKEARFLARQSNAPELHSILIMSLWNWIKEQARRHQREEAVANIQELLTYTDIPDEFRVEFPMVFRSLGLNSLLPEDLRQDIGSLEIQTELVDLFLTRNDPIPDLQPEIRAEAQKILEAFRKIEAKQDTDALELLRSIPFRSPLAEWRLFLRGLIDYYRKSWEKTEESWKRLSTSRPPWRIAEKLRKVLDDKKSSAAESGFFNLYRSSYDVAVPQKTELLDSLRTMEQYIDQGKHKELIGRFQSFRSRFRETEPILVERVLRILHRQIVQNAPPEIVRQFVERNLPLPLDPRGNRTFAFLSNHIEDSDFRCPGWLKMPLDYWQEFAKNDIDQIVSFSPKMKDRAKAVVYDFIAGQIMAEFVNIREELGEDELEENVDVERTLKEVDDQLEKAIAADPTYPDAYFHKQEFILQTQPKENRTPIHPKLAEINRRLLEHVPDNAIALEYLFQYHLEMQEPIQSRPYFERIRQIDPLSRKTSFLQRRLANTLIRQGLKQRDFIMTVEGIACNNEGPDLETMMYRHDMIPLALSYLNEAMQGKIDGHGDYFAAATKIGIEKRLPLIFAILVEGRECDAPEKILDPLEAEWKKMIAGRCNGNTAGALGDLAYNVIVSQGRYLKSAPLVEEAAGFVNRAGQVKWNCEKDLLGACLLLWQLAADQEKEPYEKTFETLVKKGLKQFPKSPYFTFFEGEMCLVKSRSRSRFWNYRQAVEKHEEFLKRFGVLRDDPEIGFYIYTAEQRLHELDDGPFEFSFGSPEIHSRFTGDDEDDEEDWDNEFDADDVFEGGFGVNPFGLPPGFNFPPDVRHTIQQQGGFPPGMVGDLEKRLPKELGRFRKLLIETLEECIIKEISPEKMQSIFMRKIQNLSPKDLIEFVQLVEEHAPYEDDWDEDDLPLFSDEPSSGNSKKKPKKKKKR